MNALLADVVMAFFFAIAPGLLVIRFIWPRILPRWSVLVIAAALGGAAYYISELLIRAEMMETAQRIGLFDLPMPMPGDGMVVLHNPRPFDFVLGAFLELVYLLLWLVPYGVIQILRNRRKQATQVPA
jgi:hypothetical protein